MNLATEQKADHEPAPAPVKNAKLGGTDIFRGALVIITALVIGGFVISRGLGGDSTSPNQATDVPDNTTVVDITGDQAGGSDESDSAGNGVDPIDDGAVLNPGAEVTEEATVDTTPETVPAAPVLRSPAEVKVLVLNAAQAQGIAGRGTEALLAASYKTAAPKNAKDRRPSAVLYTEGYEAEAGAVAAVFGPDLESIVQPVDPADLPIDDTQDANIIVVLGPDNLIPLP
jgi:hypothetical protein